MTLREAFAEHRRLQSRFFITASYDAEAAIEIDKRIKELEHMFLTGEGLEENKTK